MGSFFHVGVLLLSLGAFLAFHRATSFSIALALATAVAVILLVVAEWAWAKSETRVSAREWRTDMAYFAIAPAVPAAMSALARAVSEWAPLHGVSTELWPRDWDTWAQCALAVVLADLAAYWIHRLIHRSPLLYRFHEVHHSPRALHWLNGSRFHPVDTLVMQCVTATPFILVGAPPVVIGVTALVGQIGTFLQHTRVAIDSRGLGRILHTSLAHRAHHRERADDVRNFGGAFLVWDLVFGTYAAPSAAPLELGPDRPFPQGLWQQLKEPFRRRRRAA